MARTERHKWVEAFAAERRVLQQRRNDDTSDRLVGLAISGGGIRSATFGLGVLQTLHRLGLLKQLDYLSTVSGGGYIGAWLSANCRRHREWLDPSTDWRPSIDHLRRYSNYLSPQVGFFSADTWSMATIWMRNTLLILSVVLLGIAVALAVPFELFRHWPEVGNLRWASILLFVLGIVGIAGNQMRVTVGGAVPLLTSARWPAGLAAAVLTLVVAFVYRPGSASIRFAAVRRATPRRRPLPRSWSSPASRCNRSASGWLRVSGQGRTHPSRSTTRKTGYRGRSSSR